MENSIILSNVTPDQLFNTLRGIVREELTNLNPPKTEKKYFTRKEVSEQLHISLPTILNYTKRGILKGSRIGSRILYSENEIQQAVKEISTLKYRRA
jgi:excisionase family DNA binding protein